jgi:outer membrane protein insertion porin family
LEFNVRRSTTDSNFEPSRGSRIDLGLEQVGLLGGDYDFTRVSAGITKFWTVDEDFLNRKTVVMASVQTAYILQDDEAPIFERFFAGGRSFRGFQFRGVGPRGIVASTGEVSDEAAGGQFSLLTTLQYEFPLVDQYLRGVVFTDQGTVSEDIGLDEWRVTVGTGLRMKIPFLSQAPFAVDLAIPVLEEDGDEEELISFTLDIPFR